MAVQMTEAEALALYNYSLQGGETTVPEPEPKVEVEFDDYGKDLLKSFPRAGKALVDLPQDLTGLAATGLRMAEGESVAPAEGSNPKPTLRSPKEALDKSRPFDLSTMLRELVGLDAQPKVSARDMTIAEANPAQQLERFAENAPRAGNLVPESLTERSVPKGHSRLFDATLLGTELAAFGLPSVVSQTGKKLLGKAAQKGIPAASKFLGTTGAPLSAVKTSGLMGAGGAAGAEGGKEIDELMKNEGPYAEIVGMLLGGGLAPLLAGRSSSSKAANIIEKATTQPVKETTTPLSMGYGRQDPIPEVRGVQALAETLRGKPKADYDALGDVIAMGDETAGSLVMGVENQLAAKDPLLQAGLAGRQRVREVAVGEKVKSAIAPDPALPQASKRAAEIHTARADNALIETAAAETRAANKALGNKVVRQEQVQAASSKRVSDADDVLKAARKAEADAATTATQVETATTAPGLRRSIASSKVHEATQAEKTAERAALKSLWKASDDGTPIVSKDLVDEVSAYLKPPKGQKSRPQIKKFSKRYAETIKELKKANPEMPPEDVAWLISQLKKEVHNAYKTSKADKVTIRMEEMIKEMDTFLTKKNPEYLTAVSAERKFHEKFGPVDFKSKTPLTYLTPGMLKGQQGAELVEMFDAIGSPNVMKQVEELIRSQAKVEGVTAKFRKSYGGFLNHPSLSGLNAEIAGIEAAQTTATAAAAKTKGLVQARKGVVSADTAKQAESKAKASGLTQARKAEGDRIAAKQAADKAKLDKNVLTAYADNPKKVVDGLLKGDATTSKRSFEELNSTLSNAGQGESFRSQVRDSVMSLITRGPDTVGGLSVESMAKWNTLKPQLIDARVLSKEEAQKVTTALKGLDLQHLRASVGGVQDSSVSKAVNDILASVKATLTSKALPNTGNSLMVMSSLKRFFKEQEAAKTLNPNVLSALRRVILDPDKMAKMAQKYKTEADMTAAFTALMSESAAKLEEKEEKE